LALGSGGGDVVKTRSLAILALCSLAVTLVAIVDPFEAHVRSPVGRLLDASALSSLSQVEMVDASGTTLSIQKNEEGRWQSTAPNAGPVDGDAVRELVAVLALLRSTREGRRNAETGLAGKAASIRLHLPKRTVPKGTVEITFGAKAADGRHRWVAADESGPAYLVESHLIGELEELRGRLLSRKLLASRPGPEESIELRGTSNWFRINGGQVEYQDWGGLSAPISEIGDARIRDALAGLEFEGEQEQGPTCTENSPGLLVTIGTEKLQILECGPCASGGIGLALASRSGCAQADLWQELKTSLGSPGQLIEPGLLPSRDVSGPFRIVCGERETSVDPALADAIRLRDWWRNVDSAGGAVTVGKAPPSRCTIVGEDFEMGFARVDGKWIAHDLRSAGAEKTLLRDVAPEIQDLLNADASRFLSRALISEEPLNATRISIREGGAEIVLERSELVGVWRTKGEGRSELDSSELASRLLSTLSSLRAQDFIPASERKYPSRNTGRRLSVDYATPTEGETRHYEIWVVTADRAAACWALVDTKPPAWLSKVDCQALLTELL
jgi:hypothetical protein